MDRTFLASAALTTLSLAGYVVGVAAPYPGREASLVGLMVGVTLTAVTSGRDDDAGAVGRPDAGESTDGSGDRPTASASAATTASASDGGETS